MIRARRCSTSYSVTIRPLPTGPVFAPAAVHYCLAGLFFRGLLFWGLLLASVASAATQPPIPEAPIPEARAPIPEPPEEISPSEPAVDPLEEGESNLPVPELPALELLGPDGEEPVRDPTAPSREIRRRMLPPSAVAGQPSVGDTALPAIPEITIKAIVLSGPDSGTAMLEVEGRTLTVSLRRDAALQEVVIPDRQFAEYQPALRQLERLSQDSSEPSEDARGVLPPRSDSYTLNLNSSFMAGDLIFTVEGFSAGSLLLKAIPHGKLLLLQ